MVADSAENYKEWYEGEKINNEHKGNHDQDKNSGIPWKGRELVDVGIAVSTDRAAFMNPPVFVKRVGLISWYSKLQPADILILT